MHLGCRCGGGSGARGRGAQVARRPRRVEPCLLLLQACRKSFHEGGFEALGVKASSLELLFKLYDLHLRRHKTDGRKDLEWPAKRLCRRGGRREV